ncbi:MAG: ABC transporter permease [Anaerolineales bacterium]
MSKTFLVALREFRQRVTSRAFLLGAIGTPLILLIIWFFTAGFGVGAPEAPPLQKIAGAGQQNGVVVGYVDRAGLIEDIPEPVPPNAFRAYADVGAARIALERREITAYYVVPANYRETGEIDRISPRFSTAPPDIDIFDWMLINNLYPEAGPEEIRRLRWPFDGTGPTFVSVEGERTEEDAEDEGAKDTALPLVLTIAVMLPLFTGGSYLFQSLAKEKENRVMEILLVSLRPRQLLTGKLIGLSALILVQYAIWVAMASLALAVTGRSAGQLLSDINLSAGEVLLILPYALAGFALYAALMAGIGALAEDVENARGWIFVLTLPMMVPLYLWPSIVNAPFGPLALVLSLFPYSAPVAMLMRMTSSTVPGWQFAVGLSLLLLAVIGTIWLMGRLFRAQTLLSGESLSLQRFWSALTTS